MTGEHRRREDVALDRTVAGVEAELPEEEAEGMRGADKQGVRPQLSLCTCWAVVPIHD